MGRKYTIEEVRENFEREGYTLLSDVYVNANTKMYYKCPNGHVHNVRLCNWLSGGSRCPFCSGRMRRTIEEVRAAFNKEEYRLLSTEYKNNKAHLHYKCPSGHLHRTRWDVWVKGVRCPVCDGQAKPEFLKIKSSFESEGYTLISTEYVNNRTKLHTVCPKGHSWVTTWANWQNDCRCKTCSGNLKKTIIEVRKCFEKESYVLLTDSYINQRQKLKYRCPDNHLHSTTWSDWQSGYRCPECYAIRISGRGNCNWKGGISFEPYCEVWKDKEYKESIKERDGYKCLNPYCCSDNKNDLTIHHINYDKKDCVFSNLLTICRSCNAKANYDREWHMSWYRAVLRNRYNYDYKEKEYE